MASVPVCSSFQQLRLRLIGSPLYPLMSKPEKPLSDPCQQWSWKIALTIVGAIVCAIIALHLFGIF